MKTLKFTMKNFGKVADATIELPGITLIVGENNSGKSTVGKALYSLCSVFSNIEERVYDSKMLSIDEAASRVGVMFPIMEENLKERLLSEQVDEEGLTRLLKESNPYLADMLRDNSFAGMIKHRIKALIEELKRVKSIEDNQYRDAVLWDYFEKTFHSQIVPLLPARGDTFLRIANGDEIKVIFDGASAAVKSSAKPQYKVCYINGLGAANLLNSDCDLDALEIYERELVSELRMLQSNSSSVAGVVGARKVSNRAKLKRLWHVFNRAIPGMISRKGKGKFSVSIPGCNEPVRFENLSSGLKSFVLLWQILDQALISDDDVLILDEPEIRLHPEWQIIYAELIVLISITFNLRILLTSHSVDFVHALHLFVRKYKYDDHLCLYKSRVQANGFAKIENVPNNSWEVLFETFIRAIDILEKVRASLPEDTYGQPT